jgi:hypothetical protein
MANPAAIEPSQSWGTARHQPLKAGTAGGINADVTTWALSGADLAQEPGVAVVEPLHARREHIHVIS